MSPLQTMLMRLLPASWAQSMEAESRAWMVRCSCGHARSVWDLGGVRWKGAGEPRRFLTCPACGTASWHQVVYEGPNPPPVSDGTTTT